MRIYLFDENEKIDVQVDLKIEYFNSPSSLFIVFYQKFKKEENNDIKYDYYEHYIKKVESILHGYFEYKNEVFEATIAKVLIKNTFQSFIVEIKSDLGNTNFIVSEKEYSDIVYDNFKLLDYREFKNSVELGIVSIDFERYLFNFLNDYDFELGSSNFFRCERLKNTGLIHHKEFYNLKK